MKFGATIVTIAICLFVVGTKFAFAQTSASAHCTYNQMGYYGISGGATWTATINKTTFSPGEQILVTGTVTWDGTPFKYSFAFGVAAGTVVNPTLIDVFNTGFVSGNGSGSSGGSKYFTAASDEGGHNVGITAHTGNIYPGGYCSNMSLPYTVVSPKYYSLTASKAGTGSGTITGTQNSTLSCDPTCPVTSQTNIPEGTTIQLRASPASGSSFLSTGLLSTGWQGCDSVSTGDFPPGVPVIQNDTCNVTMNSNRPVTATFTLNSVQSSSYRLTVNKTGSGSGTVTGSNTTISCGSTCSQSGINANTNITLSASPDSGSVFNSWSGCDTTSGTSGTSCTITMSSDKTVIADLSLAPPTSNNFIDIGLRVNQGTPTSPNIQHIAIESVVTPPATPSKLRIAKNGTAYGTNIFHVALVDPGDANATKVRIKLADGSVKALRSCTLANGCQYVP